MNPITIAVAGAGHRGSGYAQYAIQHPDRARIVAVAEPRDFYREKLTADHSIDPSNVTRDWRELADRGRVADAVIIATQDRMHREPVEAFAALGYHILLEKPMAPDAESCRAIVTAAKAGDGLFAVCHVLRYTDYSTRLKQLLDDGAVGDIVSLQRLEPVGFWHQAHSFVRGNWRNQDESSFMLLAKSCHDLDWIRHIMGVPCQAVSSFGSLRHFRTDQRPEGAAGRCVDCSIEGDCPYSAVRIYGQRLDAGNTGWPVDVITSDLTKEGVMEALRVGPYGRCVYSCDNDVVDNQVVNMLFEGGRTAGFTMTAFTEARHRHTRIFGTRGEIAADGTMIDLFDFLTEKHTTIDTRAPDGTASGGHGGGDDRLMESFVSAVATGDATLIRSGPDETLESHLMVFGAEEARREARVVQLQA